MDEVRALGAVPLAGRGSLPFALVNGESLVACASWALDEAGIELFDFNVPWELLREAGRPLVLHDPLCPLTPPAFLAEAVERCLVEDRPVVAVRPVTDTVKAVSDGVVTGTLDRADLVQVVSPIVVPAALLATWEAPPTGAFAEIAAGLDALLLPAPATARRVADEEDVLLLEALVE